MDVRVNAQSQVYRLRERLTEAAVSHGAAVRADLRNIRVTSVVGSADALAFFCNMEPVAVRQQLASGDGGPLPHGMELGGLTVPGGGVYDILNALVSSNGDLRVVVDGASQVVPVAKPEPVAAAPTASPAAPPALFEFATASDSRD
jgi:hypothetical protein